MKRFLLDTHVLIWLVTEPTRLAPEIVSELAALDNEVFVSAATYWEIAMNRAKGRLRFDHEIEAVVVALSFRELPITGRHCEVASTLPEHHKDPFDRLLIAQAVEEGLILVTHDGLIRAYNVPMLRV